MPHPHTNPLPEGEEGEFPPLQGEGWGGDRVNRGFSGDRNRRSEKKTGETVEETYRLLTKGMSMEEIARERNLAQSTISGHIEKLIKKGRDIDIDSLIEPTKRRRIEELFLTSRQWGLGAVVEQGDGAVAYEEARIVRAWMDTRGD